MKNILFYPILFILSAIAAVAGLAGGISAIIVANSPPIPQEESVRQRAQSVRARCIDLCKPYGDDVTWAYAPGGACICIGPVVVR